MFNLSSYFPTSLCTMQEFKLKNRFIGIMVDNTPGLVTGLLAILKSGNCFVPINPIFPNDRIRFILKDCNINVLLTDKANYEKARQIVKDSSPVLYLVCIDDIAGVGKKVVRGKVENDKTYYCYVIYTSGSTGRPRGVPITHGNLTPLFYYSEEYLHLGIHTRVMQNLSYTFDFGVFEILTTLLFGGRLYVLSKSTVGDFYFYAYFINRNYINTLHTTPVFLSSLSDLNKKIPSITVIHLGGEMLTGKVVKKTFNLIAPRCLLVNGYGPTEASINCTFLSLDREVIVLSDRNNIPIGRPCDLAEIYILDKFFNVQPRGVAGELCIGGPGVSQGYLNRPELTAEKFKFNRSYRTYRTYIIYRTGDLARWLNDGNIEFLGRIDHQVKVRGYRIELGEIENCLSLFPTIKEAVVIARQHENGGNYLCAYFETYDKESLTVSQLRECLSKQLPDYMIPAYFIQLERIPLTGSGKIDRKALPAPDETFIDTGVEYAAPVTGTEKTLTSIWQQLLRLEKIGINDDFFQVGGDSILVNRCIARIREELHAEIPLRKFFEQPSIKALAEEIEKQERRISSIKPTERVGKIPLSFAQERLWFLQELDAENVAYFVPRVIRMKGKVDVHLIERTFTEIIRRHEILRTTFPTIDGQPVQRIQPPYAFKIPVLDWISLEKEVQEQKVSEFLSEEDHRVFDFEKGPLLRVTIIKLKAKEHLFVLTEHHLVHDGWTQGVLLREFIAIFSAYANGKDHDLPELPIQYADFAIWQKNHLKGDVLERHLNYWKEKLSGLAPLLELPADRPRPPVISGKGELEIVRLSGPNTLRLKQFSRQNGVTLFMTMLAVFKTLLYRYTGMEDLCVGTGIANRRYKEMEGMLGMVINTLPLRTQVQGEISFKECLNRVKETCLEAYQHEDTPFGKIVEKLQPERSLSYSPIFQVMFTFMDTPGGELRLPGLEMELLPTHNRSAKFDINVVVVPPAEQAEQEPDESGEILVEWEYNTDIFDVSTIQRVISHYNRLLEGGLDHSKSYVSSLPLLSSEEKTQVLYEFNDTQRYYPHDKTIHQLFAEQASKTPYHIAIVGADLRVCPVNLTYRQLNEQSGCQANLLIEKGVLADDVVGIKMERSIDLIIGILGILKSGAAYLPIDPELPQERIDYMLRDSGAELLIKDHLPPAARNLFEKRFLDFSKLFNNLAYVIYTSGSTGMPKGVPITHGNLCPLLHWGYYCMRWGPADHVIQTLAYYFDWSAWEIFLTLTSGASLYMISEELLLNPGLQLDFIRRNDITVMEATPTRFQSLLSINPEPGALSMLRCLCIGAEKLTLGLVKQAKMLITGDCRVFNLYGPTEATIISAALEIDMGMLEKYEYLSGIPIGKMVGNGPLLVLDKYLNVCPVNVLGELYITGDGVAGGYLNNPELTKQKFLEVSEPFFKKVLTRRRQGLYKTGDLARWLGNGNIEYLGRIDQQVKIRGFRIELGEIENRLLKHGHVKEAVVIERKVGEEKYLCAYIAAISNPAPEAVELKNFLAGSLPVYMIPSYFIVIDKFPLNPNGKIDLKMLPEPRVGEALKDYTAPRDEVEKMMAEIWAELLKSPSKIGIDDNFFDLGGHSLNATLLTARIHKVFNVKIPLKEFFQMGCIRQVAEYIKESVKEEFAAVDAVEKKEYYPLSAAQERMYFLRQMDEGSITYNIPAVMRLEGLLDKDHLEKVFQKLIERHESLRTSFTTINEEPVQRIHDHVEFEIECFATDVTGKHGQTRTFDLSKAPLMRVGLGKEKEGKHLLMMDMHHIITDGVAMELFVKEFMTLYAGQELPSLKVQYKDHSEWQRSAREKAALKVQEKYWLEQFGELPPVLDLPLDFPRPVVQSFEGQSYSFEISHGETFALKALALAEGTTLYMVLLSLYYIFLSRITGREDIVVGTPAAGRPHADLESIMGMFVNTLVLRNSPVWEKNVIDFIKEVNENTLAAFANQDYPYEELVEKVVSERDTGRNPLFDVMLNLQNMDISEIEIPGLKITLVPFEEGISKFDLTLRVSDAPSNLRFNFQYCTRLFKTETIERFAVYFKNIIRRATENKNSLIFELEMIPAEEKNRLLYDFNDTYAEYPYDKTIHQLFEEQVECTPDRIALVGADLCVCPTSLTYRQLNEQSHRLAGLLIEKGVLVDDIVGIMMERSIDLVIDILGILKAGAAYLPIDPEYPWERIDYMLKDSGAKLLVTTNDKEGEKVRRWEGKKVLLESIIYDSNHLKGRPRRGLHHSSFITHHSNQLAYIIYTSGSTGKPKGVLIEHRHVVRLLFNNKFQFDFSEYDVWTLFHSFCFDFSVWEMYGALLYGGKLVIVPKMTARDPVEFLGLLNREAVTILNQTPSAFYNLLNESFTSHSQGDDLYLRYVIFGGEALNPSQLRKWHKKYPKTKLINMFGITETTVHATYKELSEKDMKLNSSNVGKPIPTLCTYISDKYLKPVPQGVTGEIYVGGDGVARGYLNQVELTQGKFIGNPYRLGDHLYRSGDKGRYLENGDIEYLGRIDNQVKIRGFRIELGEIENKLLQFTKIKNAVVLAGERPDENFLCAYISSEKDFELMELRTYLSGKLPDYMIPSYFVQLEKIPLTPNGKVDRKALPKPGLKAGETFTAPRNEIEKKLVEIWSDILKRPNSSIGVCDNFFESGGHSLRVMALVSRIRKEFNVKFPLHKVFSQPTIQAFSLYIQNAQKSIFEEIDLAEKKEYYPLSSAQMRLYILNRLDQNSTAYNIPYVFQLEGILDRDRMVAAFRKLIVRHESFRTSFDAIEDIPVQRIHHHVEFEIEYKTWSTDYTDYTDDKDNCRGAATLSPWSPFIRPFDLSKAPLLRVALIKENNGKHLLMVDMHHIIADGMSMGVLVNDFNAFYNGEDLSVPRVQYKDFTEWQDRHKERGAFSAQEEYWRNEFAGEVPALDLPTDFARPAVQSYEGDRLKFGLPGETAAALKTLAIKTGTTMYTLLLAIFNIFLAKLSNREEIVTGTPVAGRQHADLEKIIGMFVNTVALRNYPVGENLFREFLEEVKEKTLQAFENQDYPYEDLVKQVVVKRDFSRNPLFDVMFALENREHLALELPGLKITPFQPGIKIAKFDLSLTAVAAPEEDTLYFYFEFCTQLFKQETIERFWGYFKQLVSSILENPKLEIYQLGILSEEEQKILLYDFNNTDVNYDFGGRETADRLFEGSAEKFPDHILVVSAGADGLTRPAGVQVTYKELNVRASMLAVQLVSLGVQAEGIVGIMLGNSIEYLTATIGIWKAGGAFLPIDPHYPQERIDYMLRDSNAKVLLGMEECQEKIIVNCKLLMRPPRAPLHHSSFIIHHSNLAYIIYTSGSTGKPKGVMVQHSSLVNRIYWVQEKFGYSTDDVFLHQAAVTFDASISEFFNGLLGGIRIFIPAPGVRENMDQLIRGMELYKISVCDLVPSYLHVFLEYIAGQGDGFQQRFSCLRLVVSGGEVLTPGLVMLFSELFQREGYPRVKLVNSYGPTETTVDVIFHECTADDGKLERIPLGVPMGGTRVYILDSYQRLQPLGVTGELCIGGLSLARGYLNNPELTEQKFLEVSEPFFKKVLTRR
ncbi:MAG: hypothetical protein QG657_5103, partial [Acidobacteriota bacterium]|nr:hypothetical protein [Acidobacteriota bacterium]